VKRNNKEDFPVPESPISNNLKVADISLSGVCEIFVIYILSYVLNEKI
jgi:hypothetical protein